MNLEGDEKIGLAIIRKAIEAPMKTIAENAGLEGSVVAAETKRTGNGFNAATLSYGNLVDEGVVDPPRSSPGAAERRLHQRVVADDRGFGRGDS